MLLRSPGAHFAEPYLAPLSSHRKVKSTSRPMASCTGKVRIAMHACTIADPLAMHTLLLHACTIADPLAMRSHPCMALWSVLHAPYPAMLASHTAGKKTHSAPKKIASVWKYGWYAKAAPAGPASTPVEAPDS